MDTGLESADRQTLVARIVQLETQYSWALARIAELEAQLSRNSRNSSKPPSSDGLRRATPPKPKSDRPRGGQPGHPGSSRELLPDSQVDERIERDPERCGICGASLEGVARVDVEIRQIADIPPQAPHVAEYRLFRKKCPKCGGNSRGKLPAGLSGRAFGPQLEALVATLCAAFRMSRREVCRLLEEAWGLRLSPASVQACCERASQAAAPLHEGLLARVRQEPVVHADETSFGLFQNERQWLWVACADEEEVFRLQPGRGKEQAHELLGDYEGVLVRDRWRPYESLPSDSQLCFAHLRRHFQAMVEAGGQTARRGRALLETSGAILHQWHRLRRGEIGRPRLRALSRPQQRRMRVVLELLAEEPGIVRQAAGIGRDLLRQWKSLWTFLSVEGVEPTNNEAERALRHAVLWRKGCFGVRSEEGAHFVERMLTLVGTARRRSLCALEWLAEAIAARDQNEPMPAFA